MIFREGCIFVSIVIFFVEIGISTYNWQKNPVGSGDPTVTLEGLDK